jgi:hypothetical protein
VGISVPQQFRDGRELFLPAFLGGFAVFWYFGVGDMPYSPRFSGFLGLNSSLLYCAADWERAFSALVLNNSTIEGVQG